MAHYKCLDCGDLTGIPIGDRDTCRKCFSMNLEHCTCGSGGHPNKCDIHPMNYYLHCFGIEVGNILESGYKLESGEIDKYPDIHSKCDAIVKAAEFHLLERLKQGI